MGDAIVNFLMFLKCIFLILFLILFDESNFPPLCVVQTLGNIYEALIQNGYLKPEPTATGFC